MTIILTAACYAHTSDSARGGDVGVTICWPLYLLAVRWVYRYRIIFPVEVKGLSVGAEIFGANKSIHFIARRCSVAPVWLDCFAGFVIFASRTKIFTSRQCT